MQFFCYHRDRPGSAALREKLVEEHWSYMDRYAAQLIARGPTLDGDTATGSVHIVDLPDLAAARAFAFDEPNFQAGVYRDVMLRRWRNVLGRTMWDFPGGREGGNRYLVLGLGTGQARRPRSTVRPAGRLDRLRPAVVRRRRHLGGHGSPDPGDGSGHGPHSPGPGPVCRYRSSRLGVRRTTLISMRSSLAAAPHRCPPDRTHKDSGASRSLPS
ncbi:YciI family protein [Nonomuraea dietziae]|uniref:YciI family protein n=1 Tax=Nonomuraea dietziae TaxID=65515 RepID=UPI0031D17A34